MASASEAAGWRRVYIDLPVDIAVAADVEAAKARMSKKDFYAQAIREKVERAQGALTGEKPKKKGK